MYFKLIAPLKRCKINRLLSLGYIVISRPERLCEINKSDFEKSAKVGGMAQWQECQPWLANFPCRTLDLQLMDDHLCG